MGTYLSRIFRKSTSSCASVFAGLPSSFGARMGPYLSRIFLKPPSSPATAVHSSLPSTLHAAMGTYFKRIFQNFPSSTATVVATLLSSLLAGMGSYLGKIPWKLPCSRSPATVTAYLPSSFVPAMRSHLSRIFCMWRSSSVSATGAASGAASPDDDDRDQPQSYDGLKTYLLKALECPVCYEVKSGPIFQCTNGHNVCATCRPHINGDKCAVCNAVLTASRNWLAEDLSSKLAGIPCKNVLEGCDEIVPETRMSRHMAVCRFGYSCLVMTSVPADERYIDGDCVKCEWRGSYREVMEHVEAEHPGHAHRGVTARAHAEAGPPNHAHRDVAARTTAHDVDLNYLLRVCNHVCLVAAHGQLFWCRLALYHETKAFGFNPSRPKLRVLACARLVASPCSPQVDGDEFSCEFQLRADSCPALTLTIACKPRPLGNDLGDEADEGQVLRLCVCLLETFISPEKRLGCNIRVTNESSCV